MKKVIVFDMDGVLVDTIPNARDAFLKLHPGVSSESYNDIHSGNYHIESQKYAHLKISETEEEVQKRQAEYADLKSNSRLFDGIQNLLSNLCSAGYIVVLNTNAYNKNCLPLLEKLEIKNLFDFIATAEVSKDKTEKFKLIEEKYNIQKEQMLFITDALGDIREADSAQVPTVAVTWGVHNERYFNREPHSNLKSIVCSVTDLEDFIYKYFPD